MKHVLLLKDGWTYIITHNILEIVVVLILLASVSLWAYFTKIIAAISTTELADKFGWRCSLVKSDSVLVLHLFTKPSWRHPWRICNRWLNYQDKMFASVNAVADHLANLGLSSSSLKVSL